MKCPTEAFEYPTGYDYAFECMPVPVLQRTELNSVLARHESLSPVLLLWTGTSRMGGKQQIEHKQANVALDVVQKFYIP